MRSRTVVITGASGLIGRHLCEHFHAAGWRVRALVRNPAAFESAVAGIEIGRLDLPERVDAASFAAADTVIHAAYSTRDGDVGTARRVNEEGTSRVLAASRAAGVRRFVFLSSLSAREDATSYYGRSKQAIESRLDPLRDLVIRPGLVLASDGGLAFRLWRAVARLPIVPLFDGGRQQVQTIHVDDLCAAVERAVEADITGVLNVAEPVGVTMKELMDLFAGASGAKPLRVPVPSTAMLLVLRALGAARIPFPVTAENLRGLITMKHVDTTRDLGRLGITVRDARQSIADLAQRSPLAAGRAHP